MRALHRVGGRAVGLVLVALAIASCSSARSQRAVFSVQPPRLQLSPGEEAVVLIRGGTLPYGLVWSGSGLGVDAPTRLVDVLYRSTIRAAPAATGNTRQLVYFYDGAGALRKVAVDIKAPALAVKPIIPDRKFVLERGDAAQFVVEGGVPPYQSQGPNSTSGNSITVSPGRGIQLDQPSVYVKPIPGAQPGTYGAEIVDASGATGAFSATFVRQLRLGRVDEKGQFAVVGVLALKVNETAFVAVDGGQPRYTPTSSHESLSVTETALSGIILVKSSDVRTTYRITVSDSLGQQASMDVTVK